MKALTLWEPWASAIVHGEKRIENRPWKPPASIRGQRFAIHAGLAYDQQAAAALAGAGMFDFSELKHRPGHVLGTAVVVGMVVRSDDTLFDERPVYTPFDVDHERFGIEFCQQACDFERWDERWLMDGQYGWLLHGVRALEKPIYARGYQGLWDIDLAVTICCGAERVVHPPGGDSGTTRYYVCGECGRAV